MAVKDFSKVRCPSCGLVGSLRKVGKEVVCQDHLCGRAFPITRSGAFLSDAKKPPPDSKGKKKGSSPASAPEIEVLPPNPDSDDDDDSSGPDPDDEDPLDDWDLDLI